MKDELLDVIIKPFDMTQDITLEFKDMCGFTFVFKKRIIMFRDRMSSAEINPLGIIYEENGECCFAPLHRSANISRIVKEYVENCPEAERFRFRQ